MLLSRRKYTHKGDNGRVLVIGGNEEFHGAPVFAALGAEHTGVDLIRLFVPKSQKTLAREWSLQFIVHTFRREYLGGRDLQSILDIAKVSDVIVMGMGLGRRRDTLRTMLDIVDHTSCGLVLDADALFSLGTVKRSFSNRNVILTPHFGEAQYLLDARDRSDDDSLKTRKIIAKKIASKYRATVLLKGATNVIVSNAGKMKLKSEGNPGMTKGGTGDALGGIIGGLMAQGVMPFESAQMGLHALCVSANTLKKRKHYSYTTEELIRALYF